MSSTVIALVILACTLGAAAFGFFLNGALAKHHVSADSRDTMKVAIGVVGTLTAMVFGLVISSAKSAYDDISHGVTQLTTDIILLDRVLARYGPEASQTRAQLSEAAVGHLSALWADAGSGEHAARSAEAIAAVENLARRVGDLKPATDTQRSLKSQAETLMGDMARTLLNTLARVGGTIPEAFLAVLAVWLVIMFAGIGAITPGSATARTGVIACAFAFAMALFLILELDTPYGGIIKISNAPVRLVFEQLGR